MIISLLSDNNITKYRAFKNLIVEFRKEHPDIEIDFIIKNKENLWNDLFNFLKGNSNQEQQPDIYEIPHSWTSLFAKLGLFLELDKFYLDFKEENYPAFLLDSIKLENTNYYFTLPLYTEILSLQYRKDMLKDVDLNMISWDNFLNLCEILKKKYRSKDFYPLDNSNIAGAADSDDILPCVLNRGASGYFSQDFSSCDTLKEEIIKAIEDYLELFINKNMPVFQETYHENIFIRSRLSAMIFSWRKPLKNTEMMIAPFPQIRRQHNIIRSFNLAVVSSTQQLEEIRIFVKWLMRQENVNYFLKSFSAFSPFKKALLEEFEKKEYSGYGEIFSTAKTTPNFSVYPSFEKMFSQDMKSIAINILRGEYRREDLIKKMTIIKGECDYLLSIY
jgi:ABC-type glycerol-3-phosphate transport system substrate-binding protein